MRQYFSNGGNLNELLQRVLGLIKNNQLNLFADVTLHCYRPVVILQPRGYLLSPLGKSTAGLENIWLYPGSRQRTDMAL